MGRRMQGRGGARARRRGRRGTPVAPASADVLLAAASAPSTSASSVLFRVCASLARAPSGAPTPRATRRSSPHGPRRRSSRGGDALGESPPGTPSRWPPASARRRVVADVARAEAHAIRALRATSAILATRPGAVDVRGDILDVAAREEACARTRWRRRKAAPRGGDGFASRRRRRHSPNLARERTSPHRTLEPETFVALFDAAAAVAADVSANPWDATVFDSRRRGVASEHFDVSRAAPPKRRPGRRGASEAARIAARKGAEVEPIDAMDAPPGGGVGESRRRRRRAKTEDDGTDGERDVGGGTRGEGTRRGGMARARVRAGRHERADRRGAISRRMCAGWLRRRGDESQVVARELEARRTPRQRG